MRRRGLCYPRLDKNMRVVKRRRYFAAEQVSYRKRSRNSFNIAGKRDLFDSLSDDLVISVLCKVSPSDFGSVLLTCRRLNGLVLNSLVKPDFRQRIVNKIMETLKRHLPVPGQEGLHELRKIAIRIEKKNYTTATSLSDYLQKVFWERWMLYAAEFVCLASVGLLSLSKQPQVHNPGQLLPIPLSANQSRQQMLSQNIQNNIPSAGVQSTASLPSALPPVSGLSQNPIPNVVGLVQL